jgi:hypothetical protein
VRPSLRNITKRTAEKARESAAGATVPAGQEPPPEGEPTAAAADRGAMRKRIRRLGRMREVQLRELGALVVELRRLGRENRGLVDRKAAVALATDEELRGLRTALDERQTVEQTVAAGVSGTCARCGTLIATGDRYCSHCGLAVEPRRAAPTEQKEPEAAAPPPPPPPPAPPPPPPPPAEAAPDKLTATAPPPP